MVPDPDAMGPSSSVIGQRPVALATGCVCSVGCSQFRLYPGSGAVLDEPAGAPAWRPPGSEGQDIRRGNARPSHLPPTVLRPGINCLYIRDLLSRRDRTRRDALGSWAAPRFPRSPGSPGSPRPPSAQSRDAPPVGHAHASHCTGFGVRATAVPQHTRSQVGQGDASAEAIGSLPDPQVLAGPARPHPGCEYLSLLSTRGVVLSGRSTCMVNVMNDLVRGYN